MEYAFEQTGQSYSIVVLKHVSELWWLRNNSEIIQSNSWPNFPSNLRYPDS